MITYNPFEYAISTTSLTWFIHSELMFKFESTWLCQETGILTDLMPESLSFWNNSEVAVPLSLQSISSVDVVFQLSPLLQASRVLPKFQPNFIEFTTAVADTVESFDDGEVQEKNVMKVKTANKETRELKIFFIFPPDGFYFCLFLTDNFAELFDF